MILVKSMAVGSIESNLYLLTDAETNRCALVDCPAMHEKEERFLLENGVETLDYILLTHGHFDHILGVRQAKKRFGGIVCIHEGDEGCLYDPRQSLASFMHPGAQKKEYADRILRDGDTVTLGSSVLRVIHTPGHTKGSVCFDTGELLFSGDTLFPGSCGRTDFPGGSREQILQSLKKLSLLEGERTVYPGHGERTLLTFEREFNPYME